MPPEHKTANKPENLQSMQMSFAAHLRDPDKHPAPAGVEDRRINIYRRLYFNNINTFLSGNFPVLRRLYEDNDWKQLVRDFCIEHRCHTPLFPELPKEFLRYLQNGRKDHAGDPPFLLELAHYEWAELALSLDENDLDQVECNPEGDLMEEEPVLSPLAWPLSYRYPVNRIRPGFEPESPPEQPTHLLVYRNRQDRVRFMQLNSVSRLLLTLLSEKRGLTGRDLLIEIAREIDHAEPSVVIAKGEKLLQDFRARDILLGTRPA
jgi:hypothetical protein